MLRLFAALVIALLSSASALAAPTSTWVIDNYKDWNEGDATAAFITSSGEVRPGWTTEKTELEIANSWSLLPAPNGDLFIGTDDEGAIYRARGKAVTKFASLAGAVAVVSMTAAADGTIYAGTTPNGEIWRVSPAGNPTKVVALKDAETVWALALGKDGKTLYAGTGPNGHLFRVELPSNKATVAFKSEDKRILSLLVASDGAVWFGTSEKAQVFRYTPARKSARAMADFAGNEITDMAEYAGGVVVAANDLDEPTTTGAKTKAAVEKAEKSDEKSGEKAKEPDKGTKPGAEKTTPSGATPPRKGGRKGKGALYRVRGDGQIDQLHALTHTYFSTVAATGKQIFAGAGDKGKIYMVDADDTVSTVIDVDQRVIAQLTHDADRGLRFITADATALYRASGAAGKAEYTSDSFDTKSPARFGSLVWRGTPTVKLETRTGNTAKPGVGWSKWQEPRNVGTAGGASRRGSVTSPPGRYIQFRATFAKAADSLDLAKLYYLPQNRPTAIEELTLKPKGSDTKQPTLAVGATKPRSPLIELSWKVENPDKDQTEYILQVRRDGDALWRRLPTGPNPLTKDKFEWNTETFPDGYYRLKVTSSDRRANSDRRAMSSSKTSRLFLIDNLKPRIDAVTVRYPSVSARATDAMSAISEMAFSVDDGRWQVGATVDGLFDSQSELLRIALPADLTKGVHTLSIRVADEAGNVGSTSLTFQVK